jgi:hypothetical protein
MADALFYIIGLSMAGFAAFTAWVATTPGALLYVG